MRHVDEIEGIDYREDTHMRPVRHHLGITAFGTNAWRGENAGDRLVPSHTEDPGNQELYVVLRGRARFEIDGETVDAPAGTLVYCAPEADRTAFAEEAGTAVLAVGSTVGEAYHGGGWEVWAPFHPQYEAGEYEAVIESARETLEASGYAAPLYNLACCEALRSGEPRMRSATCGPRSRSGRGSATSQRRTPTSTRSAKSRPSRSSSPSAIRIDGLRVRRGPNLVLDGLSVEVAAGSVTGLLGPSGSGKSTLIRSIVGVQIVEAGEVTVLGRPAGSAELRARVGYVTQAPSVYGDLTVRENLHYFARILRVDDARIEEMIDEVDLRRAGRATRRRASPAGSAPASRSRPRSSTGPSCSSSTSRPSGSTRCSAATSGSSSTGWPRRARRCSSRAM